MMIVTTGPESCGKSVLAKLLSAELKLPLIEEYARTYLATGFTYQPSDLLKLMELQISSEKALVSGVLDTDLLTLLIWWREKYGPVPDCLRNAMLNQADRHYLLCAPDIDWRPDPLRENPADRARLFDIYISELEGRNLSFSIIRGVGARRLSNALDAIKGDKLI
jgi:nicotinamide riboside kinase